MLYNFFFCFLFWAYNGLSQILNNIVWFRKKIKKEKDTVYNSHAQRTKGQLVNMDYSSDLVT